MIHVFAIVGLVVISVVYGLAQRSHGDHARCGSCTGDGACHRKRDETTCSTEP
ncbi:MAG: hypothetical protein HYV07_17475 [Deltaproteobacteria bacterium]|nr:hypothetical protein [Deltaproteobacteria bacterium]